MIEKLRKLIKISTSIEEEITLINEFLKNKIAFSTSFGIEDQVITHLIANQKLSNISIFTLDTGRLFPETYQVWNNTLLKYKLNITSFYPQHNSIELFVNKNGITAFYNSVKLRKECCSIRKVEPLTRALNGVKIWITGIRAEQSKNRNTLEKIQWDSHFKLIKYNPLLHWTTNEVKDFIHKNKVPYNKLHDKGFVSIGCAPCTRAIIEGEDFRSGRWWWENNSKKECGLHK